jgi:hypothetical protein
VADGVSLRASSKVHKAPRPCNSAESMHPSPLPPETRQLALGKVRKGARRAVQSAAADRPRRVGLSRSAEVGGPSREGRQGTLGGAISRARPDRDG